MFGMGMGEWLIIFLIILLLFGAKRLPEIARSLGKATNEFKKAKDELERLSNNGAQILADKRLNAVIVRDSKARMPYYEQLIQELDVPIRMVEIAVTILDIDKSALLDWELRLKALGGKRKTRIGGGLDVDNLASPETLTGLGLTGALTYVNNTFSLATSQAS